jgi:hypothetical protein
VSTSQVDGPYRYELSHWGPIAYSNDRSELEEKKAHMLEQGGFFDPDTEEWVEVDHEPVIYDHES